jgi:hypothetical protein
MSILISDDERFTIWMHELSRKPADAVRACLWIEYDKEAGKPFTMAWTVEVKIYFPPGREERLRGWGKTRHDAFTRLRQRLNDLRSIRVRG